MGQRALVLNALHNQLVHDLLKSIDERIRRFGQIAAVAVSHNQRAARNRISERQVDRNKLAAFRTGDKTGHQRYAHSGCDQRLERLDVAALEYNVRFKACLPTYIKGELPEALSF